MRKVIRSGPVLIALAVAFCFSLPMAARVLAQEADHGEAAESDDADEAGAADHEDGAAGHEDAEHGEAGGHNGETPHESGVPLDLKEDLALWSGVVFIVFLFVLGKFAWGPLAAALDDRESKIRADIAGAESARVKAEKMLADHSAKLDAVQDEVKEILAEARRDADQARQNILGDTQREVEAMRQRTLDEIGRARDQALKELFDSMAGQVVGATEHVLGRSLGGDDQDRLIEEALAQFSAQGSDGSS